LLDAHGANGCGCGFAWRLRSWTLKRNAHIVFYVERDAHIDVWRVLHGMRDVPAWLRDGGDAPH
jgi:toxin ParE1/3/4